MNRKIAFQVAVALQLVFLGWMVAAKERTIATGLRVTLKVAPFDPNDYLSGRYLRITPAIAQIDPAKVEVVRGRESLASLAGRNAFVELTRDGDVWDATRVVVDGSGVTPRRPFLRARVEYSMDTALHLDYSFERFYIPADGHDPSVFSSDRPHALVAVVRVPSDGAGVLEDLLVDGKPWKTWNAEEKAKER